MENKIKFLLSLFFLIACFWFSFPRNISEVIAADNLTVNTMPALTLEGSVNTGAKTELAKITNTIVATLPYDILNTKAGVETAMLSLANATISTDYITTIAAGSTYNTTTKVWTGKFVVTSKTVPANTATDAVNRSITIVITPDPAAGTTVQYYLDEGLTQQVPSYFKLKAGDYYLRILTGNPLGSVKISIDSEGTANDINNAQTTKINDYDFRYKRTISYDAQSVGLEPETIWINGSKLSSSTFYVDTVMPVLTLESSANTGFDTYKLSSSEPLVYLNVYISSSGSYVNIYKKRYVRLDRPNDLSWMFIAEYKTTSGTYQIGNTVFTNGNSFSFGYNGGSATITKNDDDSVFSIDVTDWIAAGIRAQEKIPLTVRDLAGNELAAEFKPADPAAGAKAELAKITNTVVTTLPYTTLNTQAGVETAMLSLANAAISTDYITTIASGSTYNTTTKVWTGKFVVTSRVDSNDTATDAADRSITIVISVDPALGAKAELAKITNAVVTTLPYTTLNTQAAVETAMLSLANATISTDYITTIAAGSTYNTTTKVWTGKFVVTSKTVPANTATDAADRSITIVISVDPALGAKAELAKITDASIATLPFTTENNQSAVESAMLFIANGLISTNYTASIATGGAYDSATNIWTGKFVVTSRVDSNDTATDAADRSITIVISVDPALGAKAELAKITDASIATLPFTTENNQSAVESAMLFIANGLISTNYTASIATGGAYDSATNIWTGKFVVTSRVDSNDTATDAADRSITIVISVDPALGAKAELAKITDASIATLPFTTENNQSAVESAMLFIANGLISTNYTASIATGGAYDSATNIWTGKFVVTSRVDSNDTATDAADRSITIVISVDPALGAKAELAKITDASIATLPFTTENNQSAVESAMLFIANGLISTNYTASIATGGAYDSATNIWTGKFVVTSRVDSNDTATDAADRSITIVISVDPALGAKAELAKITDASIATLPFTTENNQSAVESAMLFIANGLISTNYTASIATGGAYDSATNIWTGKFVVTSRVDSNDTATDAADRSITIVISVDPALGAKAELAKITDASIATLPFTTENNQSAVESAMLFIANGLISTNYTASIATGGAYDSATNIWTGKFVVTSRVDSNDTATDAADRSITIVISNSIEIPSNSNISLIEIPAGISDPKIKFTVSGNETLTNKEITIDDSLNTGMTAIFPAGATITGPDGWDGTIELPRSSTVTLEISGYTTDIDSAIEIGLSGSSLTFDQPVKLVFSNKAGKRIGFMVNGVFTEITTACSGDTLPAGINECKGTSGSDAFVLTKHFTQFIIYTQTQNEVISYGGGGGDYYSDTTAPTISDIKVTTVGSNSAVITWNTNEASLSWILYGVSNTYGQESKNASYTTSHSVTLTNLLPATTYHYQIKSADSSNNSSVSADQSFTTLALEKIESVKVAPTIEEDVSIGSSSTNGNYTITNTPVTTSTSESTPTEQITQSELNTTEPVQTNEEPTTGINPEQASLVSTGFNFSNYFWIGLILILLIIISGVYFIEKMKKRG